MPNPPLSQLVPAEAAGAVPAKSPIKNHGWRVVFAGVGINLTLGILYLWSVISKKIPDDWNWSETERTLPYAIACLAIAFTMAPAGWLQDRFGPRIVATLGGLLAGGGLILASTSHSLIGYAIGFGVLFGFGTSCAYSSATPAAVKWFSPARTGTIAGIVVAGYGTAPLYAAPLTEWLINTRGIPSTLLILGVAFLIIIVVLSQLLVVPPKNAVLFEAVAGANETLSKREDFTPKQVLQTPQFYAIWFMNACGSGGGLMIISKLAKIVDVQAGLKMGFVLVACLGLGNGGGRIVMGTVSDRIGRHATLFACFFMQAVLVFLVSQAKTGNVLGTLPVLAVLSVLIGSNYGANSALLPSLTKDFYGLKHFGVNYGFVHSAWGLGGFTLSLLAGWVYDMTKSFAFAYEGSIVLLAVAASLVFFLRTPQHPNSAKLATPAVLHNSLS